MRDRPRCHHRQQQTAQVEAEHVAADEAELQEADGARQSRGREIVSEHRVRARRVRRAAGTHQHAAHEKLHEVLRQPPERGDAADEGDAAGEHVLPRIEVHQARQRNADQHVEDDVGGSEQEPELLVCEVEISFDVRGHHAENLRVEKIQRRGQNDHEQAVIRRTARGPPQSLRTGRRHRRCRTRRRSCIRDGACACGYLRDHCAPLVRCALPAPDCMC
jgi:hypothetical protein